MMVYKIFRMFFLFAVGYLSIVVAGIYSLTNIIFKNGK